MINLECTNLIRVADQQLQLMIMGKKVEEQLDKAKKANIDPTNRLTNKIQKKLCKLRKKKQIYKQDLF